MTRSARPVYRGASLLHRVLQARAARPPATFAPAVLRADRACVPRRSREAAGLYRLLASVRDGEAEGATQL